MPPKALRASRFALPRQLSAHDVLVKGAPSGGLIATILAWVVPGAIFYLIWTMIFRRFAERQALGGLMAVGKSRAKSMWRLTRR